MSSSNEAIAAVNHWRGQCLDNFARAERAIVRALESLRSDTSAEGPTLHEAASHRTRDLANALRKHVQDKQIAGKLAWQLEMWGHRERQRNDLVHGCFTIKSVAGDRWALVNQTTDVKKGVAIVREAFLTQGEAKAFLAAIIDERKLLERALNNLKSLLHPASC